MTNLTIMVAVEIARASGIERLAENGNLGAFSGLVAVNSAVVALNLTVICGVLASKKARAVPLNAVVVLQAFTDVVWGSFICILLPVFFQTYSLDDAGLWPLLYNFNWVDLLGHIGVHPSHFV